MNDDSRARRGGNTYRPASWIDKIDADVVKKKPEFTLQQAVVSKIA